MHQLRSFIFFILIILTALTVPVMAQQENGTTSLLPDIDPQDIEIRGDFEVRFPGLERQPVLGFSPRPAVYRIDPDRMPFIESDDEIVAAIPISELEPALKPEQHFIRFADQRNLFARIGMGTFQSPEIRIIAETPVRENESLALDLGHHSSEGDRDFSSFRNQTGNLQWTRQSGSNRFGFGISGSSSFNYSPYPGPRDSLLIMLFPDGDFDPQRISHSSFGLEGRWQHLEHAYRGWQSALSLHSFSNEGYYADQELRSTKENRYNLHINRFWEGSLPEQVFGLQVRVAGSTYDTREDESQYWLTNSVGTRYRHLFGLSHHVEAWMRFYQLYDPVNNFDLYLYPDIHYRFEGTSRVNAKVRIRGFVRDPSLEKWHERNRFALQVGSEMEHERGLHIQLQTGFQFLQNLNVYTGLDYWQYYNRGYFTKAPELDESEHSPYFSYQFLEDAIHVEWFSGLTGSIPSMKTSASVELGLNYSSANEEIIPSGVIPYVPKWKGSVQFMSHPMSWIDMALWMDILGERQTVYEDEVVDGFVQLGFRTDVQLHRNFGVYVKALNVLNQDYEVWQHYQERPFQLFGGLTLHW